MLTRITNKLLLLLPFLIFWGIGARGQKQVAPDTIYIYEEVVVYDTVRLVKPKRKVLEVPQIILPVKRSFSEILPKKKVCHQNNILFPAATIFQNSIIDSKSNINKQNNESMKAKHLLTAAIITSQIAGYAQLQYGISAGGGVWWAHGIAQNAVTEVAPTFNLGAFISKPVIENKVNFEWELQYSYLASNYSYKVNLYPELWGSIGDSEAATAYHQLSFPFRVEWILGNFSPFIGAEYTYRRAEKWVKDWHDKTLSMNRLGILLGLKYHPASTWSFSFAYDAGITDDFTLNHLIVFPDVMSSGLQIWKSSWVGFSAFYTLNEKGETPNKMISDSDVISASENKYPSTGLTYALIYRMSMASQVFSYVGTEDQNKYIEGYLPSIGIGIGVSKRLNRYFELKPQVSYIRKGCRGNEIPEIQPITSPQDYYYIEQTTTYKNQFHYLSLDMLAKIQSPRDRKINPYFQSGFRGDALLSKTINYKPSQNSENDYKDFSRFNYGVVNALGITFNHNYYIEVEQNFDLGYLVNNDAIRVKNWMWGINVGININ